MLLQRTGRAYIDALTTVYADCIIKTAVFRGAYNRVESPVYRVYRSDRLDIIANAHASSAKHAAVRVPLNRNSVIDCKRKVNRKRLLIAPVIFKVCIQCIRKVLQFAGIGSCAALTSCRVVGKNQFKVLLTDFHNLRRMRFYLHSVLYRIYACSLKASYALHFHQTHSAASDFAHIFQEAEGRNMNIYFFCSFKNRIAARHIYLNAVNCNMYFTHFRPPP